MVGNSQENCGKHLNFVENSQKSDKNSTKTSKNLSLCGTKEGKTVLKCAHCGRKVEVNDVLVEEIGEYDYVCEVCATPDWTKECIVCGQRPVHRVTGMCGPCTFGEADTINGEW